jgi:hypothetical protein
MIRSHIDKKEGNEDHDMLPAFDELLSHEAVMRLLYLNLYALSPTHLASALAKSANVCDEVVRANK